jgi:2-methylcitrate dehydratase PrpD
MHNPSAATGITARIADHLANLTYESLPPAVTATLKHLVLDTLGTTLAAGTLGEGCRELVAVARGAGGAPESTLLGFGPKVPAAQAALVNGGLAHALNYDPGHLGLIFPAALAAAERVGGVSGREFLAGLAAGVELAARLARARPPARSENASTIVLEGQLFGYFGTAAAASRVLKLNASQMHSALGLALMQAAGTMQVVLEGDPPAKAIYGAFANHGGMLAALLAAQGLGAACSAIDGEAGLYGIFYGDPGAADAVIDGLGEEYELVRMSFKPWPTSGIAHPFIEAALDLATRHNLDPATVEEIQLRGGPQVRHWFEPEDQRKRPQNAAMAANSVYYAVAKALANRRVTLADFTAAGLFQPETLQLMDRMHFTADPELGRSGVVEVVTDGERIAKRVDTPRGRSANPMTQDQLVEKFRDCARYAATPLPPANLEEVISLVSVLEELPDVSAIPALLGESR